MIPFNGLDPTAYEQAGLNARALKVSSRGEGVYRVVSAWVTKGEWLVGELSGLLF